MRELSNIDWEKDEDEDEENEIEFNLNAQNAIQIKKERYYVYSFSINGEKYNFSIFSKGEHPSIQNKEDKKDKNFEKFYLSSFIKIENNKKLMPIDIMVSYLPVEAFVWARNFEQAECKLFDIAYSSIKKGDLEFAVSKSYSRENLLELTRIPKEESTEFIKENNLLGFVKHFSIKYEQIADDELSTEKIHDSTNFTLKKAFKMMKRRYDNIMNGKKNNDFSEQTTIF